jgi:hypothetical protein
MKLAILPVSKHCRNKLDICRHCMYGVNAVSMSCIARTVAECKKKWQDVQGTTKKKEAARSAIARANNAR